MTDIIDQAFILAAGKGTRLAPYTDTIPKPMVEVGGSSIIRRTIAKLKQAGVKKIVINLHHLADVLESHLSDIKDPALFFSHEDVLLDTGGGVKKALPLLDSNRPFYLINGDALWDDAPEGPALSLLADDWDDARMDMLLLLEPKDLMHAHAFVGDYHKDADGRAVRAKDRKGNYMFAGIRIVHPRVFHTETPAVFSFLALMDEAEAQGRLFALSHAAAWYHISTPEDLKRTDAVFRAREEQPEGNTA